MYRCRGDLLLQRAGPGVLLLLLLADAITLTTSQLYCCAHLEMVIASVVATEQQQQRAKEPYDVRTGSIILLLCALVHSSSIAARSHTCYAAWLIAPKMALGRSLSVGSQEAYRTTHGVIKHHTPLLTHSELNKNVPH